MNGLREGCKESYSQQTDCIISLALILIITTTLQLLSCIYFLPAFNSLSFIIISSFLYYVALVTITTLHLLLYIYYLSLFSHHCNYYLASIITIILHFYLSLHLTTNTTKSIIPSCYLLFLVHH